MSAILPGESQQNTACQHCDPWLPFGGRGHRAPVHGTPAIEVIDLSYTYPGATQPALTSVSLRIEPGERVGLLGPNGAGKSTLLRNIAGILRSAQGTIRLLGNPVGACHHRTAYLPQRSALDWKFPITAGELVMTGRYVHLGWFRGPTGLDHSKVSLALDQLGLRHLADVQIGQLSGGQQQRLLIARALVQEASIYLLDEPLNAVDQETREVLDQVLAAEASRGSTILAATHEVNTDWHSFDRILRLFEGKTSSDVS